MWDNGNSVKIEATGNFKLLLNTDYYLIVKKILAVLSFRRNLVPISILDK